MLHTKAVIVSISFSILSTAFNVRLAERCLVAQQQMVKIYVSDHLSF